MTRSSVVVASSLAALLGCGEVEVDTGRACTIPVGMTCSNCFNPPFSICSFEPQTIDEDWFDGCDQGEFPADSAQQISVWLGPGHGDSWDLECSVEQTGDRELLVQASYRWRPDQDADIEPDLYVTCQTPPLAAGVWTIRYGQGQGTVHIGSADAPLTCVDSGNT